MELGKQHLRDFTLRWRLMTYLEVFLYALGFGLLFYFIAQNLLIGLAVFLLVFLVLVFIVHPWTLNVSHTSTYIDAHIAEVSFSTGLLLLPETQLTGLAKLQRYRTSERLGQLLKGLTPPNRLKQAFSVMLACIVLGFVGQYLLSLYPIDTTVRNAALPEQIQFNPIDSLNGNTVVPKLEEQRIVINYPTYTRLSKRTTSDPNIKAVVHANIQWYLTFDVPVTEVYMEHMGDRIPLQKGENEYVMEMVLEASGFYNFTFNGEEGGQFASQLFSLEALPDAPPEIEILDLPQYTYFDTEESMEIQVRSTITDDFGIADAYIIATVSKGSGESVKFREEKLNFKESITSHQKQLKVTKRIDLGDLKMDMGDELYFYVEALDEKQPKPNITRSETYFAVINDTVTDQFAVEGNLGVNQMPDYFRSQRQLIIDTEKLIKDKPTISVTEFKSRSNELGFDQKALRLKYGQFMGDESEMAEAANSTVSEAQQEEDHEHDEEDPLKGYTHDHDGDNEHNLVVQENGEDENDPLHDYLHNHDDPEESTLFEESLKTKLRKALTIMWDAELHLRLYAPEKSLPFQYDALKLIQEIKNSARIYVHRIGFDPPPIKEESRLTGTLKDVGSFQKRERRETEPPFQAMEDAVARLEQLIAGKTAFKVSDRELFTTAGNELAQLAIDAPRRYLPVLQGLKRIQEKGKQTRAEYKKVQKGLLAALPEARNVPGASLGFDDEINALFLKELENYD